MQMVVNRDDGKIIGFQTYLLSYLNHHRNIPFSTRSILAIFGHYGYKKPYIDSIVSKLRRVNYISGTIEVQAFVFKQSNFDTIRTTNPELAKVISDKVFPNDEPWQV